MKTATSILLILCALFSYSQRTYVYGTVVDSSKFPIKDASIRNGNAGLITTSDSEGTFKIPARPGDSLTISYIGYETIRKMVDESWMQGSTTFQLIPKTTFLDEVTVTKFPEYQQFKEQILETNPQDTSFQVFGIPKVAISEEDRLNASLKSRGPFSLIHNTFSKRAKEQKKLRRTIQNQNTTAKASKKFSRAWVAQVTQLEGDKLTSFIAYCDFSEAYIVNTPEYIIQEDLMALLPRFLKEYDQKG